VVVVNVGAGVLLWLLYAAGCCVWWLCTAVAVVVCDGCVRRCVLRCSLPLRIHCLTVPVAVALNCTPWPAPGRDQHPVSAGGLHLACGLVQGLGGHLQRLALLPVDHPPHGSQRGGACVTFHMKGARAAWLQLDPCSVRLLLHLVTSLHHLQCARPFLMRGADCSPKLLLWCQRRDSYA
jgi:hypothetical protein